MQRYFLLTIVCVAASCTQSQGQTPIMPGRNIPVGTLSEFHDVRSPGAITSTALRTNAAELKTKRVDLSQTIKAYADAKGLSLAAARLESFMFFGLVPNISTQSERVEFKKVATDVFEITATENYFRRLPSMQRCLELGKKQVVVAVQTFSIAPHETEAVTRLMKPETIKVHYDRIPNVSPIATSDAVDIQDFRAFVSSSTITRQNVPVTIGEISAANAVRLNAMVKNSETASVVNNPTLSALPGQAATISDMAYQPFVVGAETSEKPQTEGFSSPTVQALERGTTIRVKALPVDGKIQLMVDIAISRIMNVDAFQAPSAIGEPATNIQLPNQRIRQVHLASVVEPFTTILIDPNLPEPSNSGKTRDNKKANRKLLIALTARIEEMDPELASDSVALTR